MRFSGGYRVTPVDISVLGQICRALLALQNETFFGLMTGLVDGCVKQRFVFYNPIWFDSTATGNDHFRFGIIYSGC